MKIVETTGCMSDCITFDGNNWNNHSKEEQTQILEYLLEKVKENLDEGCIQINDIVHLFHYDDYEDLGRCDTCFDTVYEKIYNI